MFKFVVFFCGKQASAIIPIEKSWELSMWQETEYKPEFFADFEQARWFKSLVRMGIFE